MEVGVARAGHIGPFVDVVPGQVEALDAVVLTVADVDAVLRVDAHLVQQRELAWTGARLAPRVQKLTCRREVLNAVVAVAV